jgi:hypothetical protein
MWFLLEKYFPLSERSGSAHRKLFCRMWHLKPILEDEQESIWPRRRRKAFQEERTA